MWSWKQGVVSPVELPWRRWCRRRKRRSVCNDQGDLTRSGAEIGPGTMVENASVVFELSDEVATGASTTLLAG